MYFDVSSRQFDGAVAPTVQTLALEPSQSVPSSRRQIGLAALRSVGVLVVSFILVFGALYTVFTWPLVWIRGEYFVENFFENENTAEVQAESPVLPLVVEDATKDSDADGYTDAEELAAGYDPYSKQPVKLDSDSDGIKDDVERSFYGTDPYKADTDGDGYPDLAEIVNGHSPLRPANYGEWIRARTQATIRIPEIKVDAPVVWSKNPEDIEDDLSEGVIHYPGTANPGEQNNVVITGHSSFWSWEDTKYGTIFALIDQLEQGDKVFVDYTGSTYVYEVVKTEITDPYDLKYFGATQEGQLTLMTCYPLGSTKERYYVIAKLVGQQPQIAQE